MLKPESLQPYGLVLAGGKSLRMGQDKALLDYHGMPQVLHAQSLLMQVCERVFLSIRPDQCDQDVYRHQAVIEDCHHDIGPMGGLLSAFKEHSDRPWLVVACDLPLLNADTLRLLLSHRNSQCDATAFINAQGEFFEPLCSLYEPHCFSALWRDYEAGQYSLRRFLEKRQVQSVSLKDEVVLLNVNTPEAQAGISQGSVT